MHMGKAIVSEKTMLVRAPGGPGNYEVAAYEQKDGTLVAPSQFRQPITGPKCHGGHCNTCGAELEAMTQESFRGKCDECSGVA
jgi:hypothetical protein